MGSSKPSGAFSSASPFLEGSFSRLVPRISSNALNGSTECCGTASARSSWRRDDAFVVLRVEATLETDAEGVEASERDDDRGLTPGRGGRGPGPGFVGRRGRGELVPDREAGEGGLGLRSCHILRA